MTMTMASVPSEVSGDDAPDSLVLLAKAMIGIEHSLRFALRPLGEGYGPYALLHSLDEGGLNFVVVPPGVLYSDYRFEIPEADVELLELETASDVETWVLVTRRGEPMPTVNLLGPIVVNKRTRRALQLVLQESGYGAAVPVDAGTARPTP